MEDVASSRPPPNPHWLRTLAREPLVHFLLLGVVLFIGVATYDDTLRKDHIVVGETRIAKLASDYAIRPAAVGGNP